MALSLDTSSLDEYRKALTFCAHFRTDTVSGDDFVYRTQGPSIFHCWGDNLAKQSLLRHVPVRVRKMDEDTFRVYWGRRDVVNMNLAAAQKYLKADRHPNGKLVLCGMHDLERMKEEDDYISFQRSR